MTLETRITDLATAIGTDIKTINTQIGQLQIATDTFIYTQAIPSAVWVIEHNLNKYPSVSVVDSAGSLVEGGVEYNSANTLTVSFVGGFSGKAYLN